MKSEIDHPPVAPCCGAKRRQFLWETGAGFTGLALSALLAGDGFFARHAVASGSAANVLPRAPHFAGKAKSVIFVFCYGGPPQMDLFDYKPELQQRDGQTINLEIRRGSVKPGTLLASRRSFKQYGQTGQWCSDALPHLSQQMDKLAVIKSLYADSFAHGSAMIQLNTGRIVQGHPSLGSWLAYGLGTQNQNLPSFVVMLDPRGGPISGAANWMSGYMPARYQATVLRTAGDPILDLSPVSGMSRAHQREQVDAINTLNAEHLRSRPGFSELQARIASYELAFQLQSTAPEVLDLAGEDLKTLDLYGVNDPKPTNHQLAMGPAHFGRQCLIARRLVERGVRFVQIYSGGGHFQENWDAHVNQEENLKIHCPEIDKPLAGLLTDLERRGMLDETLIVWGGEFGRQPVAQGPGRDHNPKGFTYWLAGGGVKPGSYGETDELGHEAVRKAHHVRDLHATILHLMGLNHHDLKYLYNGLDHRLTGVVPAEVIGGLLA